MKRILIVDDSLFFRLSLRSMLESNGYQVVGEAADCAAAIDLYKSTKPDLVTMDINMPENSGVGILRDIAALDPKVRFIIISAVDRRLVWDQCAGIGPCEYVSKPVEWSKLKTALGSLAKASARPDGRRKNPKRK